MIIVRFFNSPKYNEVTAPIKRLYRPQIKAVYITFFIIMFCILQGIHCAFLHQLCNNSIANFKFYIYLFLFYLLVCSDFLALFLILLYQRFAPSYIRLRCCLRPTCSNYAKIAIYKYGLFIALPLIICRLYRCSPAGGIDFP